MQNLDLFILHAVNSFCGVNWYLDRAVAMLEWNNLIKQGPFVIAFWVLWFKSNDQNQSREKLILVFFAVFVALVANRVFSELMPFRARPIYTPEIGIRLPLFKDPLGSTLNNFSSFPSDHAALLFAMAAGVGFVSRFAGILLSGWATCVLLSRVYFGIHFPSDILIGALIGAGAAVIVNRISYLKLLATWVVAVERRWLPYFYASIFVITFEIGTLFDDVRQIGTASFQALRFYLHSSL